MAAAAGLALLVTGCGDEGATPSGGSGANGVKLEATTVAREIDAAAKAAGFTKDSSVSRVKPELKECMVDWVADDPGRAADPKKSAADTIAGLVEAGWTEGESAQQGDRETKTLTKGDWEIRSASELGKGIKALVFAGTRTSPECVELLVADLGSGKG
ncbi:hypothetical protein ACF1BN_25815 [Streptomyces sp. NPDC014861]|uniref:hypothetical protein n=1 Tax=Streptomyces sp. NPDC014861 TaxID=3364923 RepID=UPI00370169E7